MPTTEYRNLGSSAGVQGGREEGREETIKKADKGIMNVVLCFSVQSTRVKAKGTEYTYRVDQST